jgi:hypothetical protein
VTELRNLKHLEAAAPTADLLEGAQARWEGTVIPWTSMLDLLFAPASESFPWSCVLRVSRVEGGFEFTLSRDDDLVEAERVHEEQAPEALDAYLSRLTDDRD